MFAALGTKVTVVERRERMLDFCDLEIVEALKYHLRDLAVTFRFRESVASVERMAHGAITVLESGKRIPADTVMYSAGRHGMTGDLSLDAARPRRGPPRPDQGRRRLPHRGPAHLRGRGRDRLPVPGGHLDGAGPPRRPPRVRRARLGDPRDAADRHLHDPRDQLRRPHRGRADRAKVPFEVGVSRYRELARGQIIGDSYGMLKLLVSPDDRRLLGVHVFGTGATELVHIGQTVMGCGGTIDYLVNAVFNYPTLAESYKVAALDAMNKMRHIARLSG